MWRDRRVAVAALVLVWAAMVAARVTGPSDLLDNDQMRPAQYAMDVLLNGSWVVQRDVTGDIASKPPLYVWCAALLAHAQGEVTRLSLYGPTAAAILGSGLLTWWGARRWFGAGAGLWAGFAVLCSLFAAKHVALARTDAMFCFTVTCAALLGFRAWNGERWGWTCFWLACAAATLTKGPTGVLLASLGFIAAVWDLKRARGEVAAMCACGVRLWVDHCLGVLLYLALAGGWFILAWMSAGQAFIDKVIGKELVGHATRSIGGAGPLEGFYTPSLYFLAWFAPWCAGTLAGLWTVFTRPAAERGARRFERFAACWFIGGMAVFSIAPHQRPDLLLPLIPAAAVLAGREIDWWLARVPRSGRAGVVVAATAGVAMVCGVCWQRHIARRDDVEVVNTRELAALCAEVRREFPGARVIDVDASFGFQYFMGTHSPRATYEEAARLLAGDERAVVGVKDGGRLMELAPSARRAGEAAGTVVFIGGGV